MKKTVSVFFAVMCFCLCVTSFAQSLSPAIDILSKRLEMKLLLRDLKKNNPLIEQICIKMYSDNNSILIGKDGRTLTSLQTLIRQSLSNQIKFNVKVNLDASNYKIKKERFFEKDIKNIINDVMKSKDEVKLDAMNSYKRRIVHSIASEYYNIETESFGEEPERYVVIRYVEK